MWCCVIPYKIWSLCVCLNLYMLLCYSSHSLLPFPLNTFKISICVYSWFIVSNSGQSLWYKVIMVNLYFSIILELLLPPFSKSESRSYWLLYFPLKQQHSLHLLFGPHVYHLHNTYCYIEYIICISWKYNLVWEAIPDIPSRISLGYCSSLSTSFIETKMTLYIMMLTGLTG